jgi:hypothetical protein
MSTAYTEAWKPWDDRFADRANSDRRDDPGPATAQSAASHHAARPGCPLAHLHEQDERTAEVVTEAMR